MRVREQLMLGASQIKLTAGGGVASPHSPVDVSTFTEAELRAAVEAAENWGTYVTVHAYTSAAIQRAIAAGVSALIGTVVSMVTAQTGMDTILIGTGSSVVAGAIGGVLGQLFGGKKA